MSKDYVGKIKNQGSQIVKAPQGGAESKKGTRKVTGNDLRTGSKGK